MSAGMMHRWRTPISLLASVAVVVVAVRWLRWARKMRTLLEAERAGRTRAEAKLRQAAQASDRNVSADTPQPIQAIGSETRTS